MKKNIFLLTLALLLQYHYGYGQKFGFIDSEFILKQMPEYKKAEKELDKLAEGWQKELEKKYQGKNYIYNKNIHETLHLFINSSVSLI